MRLFALTAVALLAAACSSSKSGDSRPPANAANSHVTLRAGSVAADGTTPATVTVTVRDDAGGLITGAPVSLAYSGGGTVSAIRGTTDVTGTAVFSVTSATPTVGAVTASIDSASVGDAPTLAFHDCEYGAFVNGACVPPPFVVLPPAIPANWAGVKPMTFAVGDLDGNGLDDVVVPEPNGVGLHVLVSTGDGQLVPRAHYPMLTEADVVVADFTGDAIADVVTVGQEPQSYWYVFVIPGSGDGTLQPKVGTRISQLFSPSAAADLDGDGDLDLVARVGGGVGVLLNEGNGSFGALAKFTNGTWIPNSLALADLNGDGRLDVITAYSNSNEVEVRLGVGDGTFGEPVRSATGLAPKSVATGDVDGDGDLDVVTANYGDSANGSEPMNVSVLLGNGDGTLGTHAEFEAGLTPQSVAVADFDGDGLADVVTADTNGASVSVLRATGGGALAAPIRYESPGIPWCVAAAHLDAGTSPDLVALDYGTGTFWTALGRGDGTFAASRKAPLSRYPGTVVAGDVTGDGLVDLVSATGIAEDVTISVGTGDGTFASSIHVPVTGNPSNGRVLATGDLDGANGADAILMNLNTREISVLLSSGGTLALDATYALSSRSQSLAIGDLDEDGVGDVVVGNISDAYYSTGGKLGVFLGSGGGALSPEVTFELGGCPRAVALGDLNGDLHLDVAAVGLGDLRVALGDGTGAFGTPAVFPVAPSSGSSYGKASVELADLDGDGDLDVVATDGTNVVQVFANDGKGALGAPAVYPVGAAPYGVALGDVDGDGHVDAVTANHDSQSITILQGLGDGTFAEGVAYTGYIYADGILVTSLNGDVYGDIVVADPGRGILPITLGSPNLAGWTPIPLGERPSDLVVTDLNGDGKPDLVAIAYERSGLSVAMGIGGGAWAPAVSRTIGGYPNGVSIADVNADGKLDAVVTHDDPFDPSAPGPKFYGLGVLLGNGDGTFGAETIYQAGGDVFRAALGDVNGDGRVDAVVPSPASALLLTQNADGSFAAPVALPTAPPAEALLPPVPELPASDPPSCVAVLLADLNGDGKLDLVAANAAPVATSGVPVNEVAVLLGNGDGTFQPRTAYATVMPVRLLAGDLDADGALDVAVATNWSTLSMMDGDGLGGFTVSGVPLPLDGIFVASGDLDLDGRPDLVTSSGSRAFAAHRGTAAGTFESFTFSMNDPVRDLEVADLDGDGRPDVAVLTVGGVFPLFTRLP